MIPLNSIPSIDAFFFKEALVSLGGHNLLSHSPESHAVRKVEKAFARYMEPGSMEVRERYAKAENLAEAILFVAVSQINLGHEPELILQRIEQSLRQVFPQNPRLGELVRRTYALAEAKAH